MKHYNGESPPKDCGEEAGQGAPAIAKGRASLLGRSGGSLT